MKNKNNFEKKSKWTTQQVNNRWFCISLLMLFMMALAGFGLADSREEVKILEQKQEAIMEIIIFETEWLAFELERNNISIEESSDDFLAYKFKEILEGDLKTRWINE